MDEAEVRVEISDLIEPVGSRLIDVLDMVREMPDSVPRDIVELVARVAFINAYTQVTIDLNEMYMGTNKEIEMASNAAGGKILAEIFDKLAGGDNTGEDNTG